MATAVSARAATTGVKGGVGLCSRAVAMATAVNAGAATAGVRGGIGLCCCAVTMATAVCAGAATARIRGGVGLCSCAASIITLVSSREVGVLEYVYGQWSQTCLPEVTNSILAICHVATSSMHHHSISQTVRKRPHPKVGVGESCVVEVRP